MSILFCTFPIKLQFFLTLKSVFISHCVSFYCTTDKEQENFSVQITGTGKITL